MATNPTRPGAKSEEVDPETQRVIEQRLATFDEDVKTASPWAEVEARILQKLKPPQPR
jgi:hypothetical protein